MLYAAPGTAEAPVQFKARYDNFIGGRWVAPVQGQYFDNITPTTGKVFCQAARSTAEDIELALDAAHAAATKWGHTSVAERALVLCRIADRMEANLEKLAYAETVDNGKPIRETLAADIPLAIDHFRYFASCIRAQEGSLAELDADTVAYHLHEPLGVVGQIIPWNFPILMAAWKLAPAVAAGNCVVMKPAEQTPISLLVLMDLIADLLPAGVVNVVNGFGLEAGKPLASSPRIAKIAFTGETTTGRLIMQYASQNLIPVTLELGGKSPNIFFPDVAAEDDDFFDKAIEGFVMFALNQGEVCTCPSRALIHEGLYDRFMERALERVAAIKQGNPLDTTTMIGAQASSEQLHKILSYSHGFADVDQAAAAPGLFIDYLDRVREVPTIGEIDRALRGLVAALAPRRIVEIGCGTGDLLADLCQAGGVPAAGLGIEKSARLAEEAALRHSDQDSLDFLVHDFAEDDGAAALAVLGFGPASTDAIVLNRVVQHLTAPLPLLRNALPLLRPGGQMIISDVDWTTLRLDLPDRETGDRVVAEHVASIITPDAGSTAGALLRAAGLNQVALKVGIVHRIEDFELADHLFSLRAAMDRLVERGAVTARIAERWLTEAAESESFAAEVLQTIFVGTMSGLDRHSVQ